MEDQSVNGDIWNKQASLLLNKFGWKNIGDHDIDIKGSDDKIFGIDTLMTFETPLKTMPQSVILEAKRYKSTSFQPSFLQAWVKRIDEKLVALRDSSDLFEMFPILESCTAFDVGVILIWFSDTDEYKAFRPTFIRALESVSISWRERKAGKSSIFVLDNSRIMRLCALEKKVSELGDSFRFCYTPAFQSGKMAESSHTLTIEYAISDVVLGIVEEKGEDVPVVFYFGENNLKSFKMLGNALSRTYIWEKRKMLRLYLYESDIEIRKIRPSIKEMFSGIDDVKIEFLDKSNELPSYLKNIMTDE